MPTLYIYDTGTGCRTTHDTNFTTLGTDLRDAQLVVERIVLMDADVPTGQIGDEYKFSGWGYEPVHTTGTSLIARSVADSEWGTGHTLIATLEV